MPKGRVQLREPGPRKHLLERSGGPGTATARGLSVLRDWVPDLLSDTASGAPQTLMHRRYANARDSRSRPITAANQGQGSVASVGVTVAGHSGGAQQWTDALWTTGEQADEDSPERGQSRHGGDATATPIMCRESVIVGRASGVLAAATILTVATGIAAGTPSDAAIATARPITELGVVVQIGASSQAVLDYFTFIPQALLLLIAVGLRRYVLDDEDVPWWLDGAALRARAARLVPTIGRRSSGTDGNEGDSNTTTGVDASGASRATSSAGQTKSPGDGTATSRDRGSTPDTATASSASGTSGGGNGPTNLTGDTSSTPSSSRPDRTSGPVPDRLALSYRNQRVAVGDGDTVDEKIRAMLRAAGEGDHAKWIDDRHLLFIRDEHGFTLVVHGENPTRLNGERLRPGDRARVYPGDEIELSGVVTLAVEGT